MNEFKKNALEKLEEFFKQAEVRNLCQQLVALTPDDPCHNLYTLINEFFERLTTAIGYNDFITNPLLTAILENAPYGIIIIDAQGAIEFSNKLADFLLAQSDMTLTGQSLFKVLSLKKADTRKLSLLLQEKSTTLRPQRTTLTFPNQQDTITLSFTLIPYHDSGNGHQQRTVVFIEDLTGKATLSDAINFYTENLESMVKQKTKEIQAMQANTITTALNSIKTSGVAWI